MIATTARRRAGLAGIEVRHKRACRWHKGGRCNCTPSYRAEVWNPRTKRPEKGPALRTVADCRSWKLRRQEEISSGHHSRPTASETVAKAASEMLNRMRSGQLRTPSGHTFAASTVRSYESVFNLHVLARFGHIPISDLRRTDLQDFVDRQAMTSGASTVHNIVIPLRTLFRFAIGREMVATNPTEGLQMPAKRGRRERVASPDEIGPLLGALRGTDRAVFATALFAGPRRGELRGLEWRNVDLEKKTIRIEWSFDRGKLVRPKSEAGYRTVPILDQLLPILREQHAATGGLGRVFPGGQGGSFGPEALLKRARKAWAAEALAPITLHECRHTFASLMAASHIRIDLLKVYMGHASITTTIDRYGHFFPGDLALTAEKANAFLASTVPDLPAAVSLGRPHISEAVLR